MPPGPSPGAVPLSDVLVSPDMPSWLIELLMQVIPEDALWDYRPNAPEVSLYEQLSPWPA